MMFINPYMFGSSSFIFQPGFIQNGLYAAGLFETYGGVEAYNLIKVGQDVEPNGKYLQNLYTDNMLNYPDGFVPTTAIVNCFLESDGYLYVAGAFSSANNIPNTQNISRYKMDYSGNIINESIGNVNGEIRCIAKDENGNIYIGGDFTEIDFGGIISVSYLAKFDPYTNTWSAINGLTLPVNCLAIDSAGKIYAGGEFNLSNGDPINYFGMWDGSWNDLGMPSGSIIKALILDNNDVYVAGLFTDAGGEIGASNFALYSNGNWFVLGDINDIVNTIYASVSGIYIGGDFTEIDSDTFNRIAYLENGNWYKVGNGLTYEVNSIAVDENEFIFAATLGPADKMIYFWNKTNWQAFTTQFLAAEPVQLKQLLINNPKRTTLLHLDEVINTDEVKNEYGNNWKISNINAIDPNEKRFGLGSLNTNIGNVFTDDSLDVLNFQANPFSIKFHICFHSLNDGDIIFCNNNGVWESGAAKLFVKDYGGNKRLNFSTYDFWIANSNASNIESSINLETNRYYEISLFRSVVDQVFLLINGHNKNVYYDPTFSLNLSFGDSFILGYSLDAHIDEFETFNGYACKGELLYSDENIIRTVPSLPAIKEEWGFTLAGDIFSSDVVSLFNIKDANLTGTDLGWAYSVSSLTDQLSKIWYSNYGSVYKRENQNDTALLNFEGPDFLYTTDDVSWNIGAGEFSFDWILYLTNISEENEPAYIFTKADAIGAEEYEISFAILKDYFRVYWGSRGVNQAILKMFWPKPFTLDTMHKIQFARDADGNWLLELDGVPYTSYQISPLSSVINFDPVVNGIYQDTVDFGDTSSYVYIGKFSDFGIPSTDIRLASFRYTKDNSRLSI